MELNQEHRSTNVDWTANIKSSRGYQIQFGHEHKEINSENISQTHLVKNIQEQVQIEKCQHWKTKEQQIQPQLEGHLVEHIPPSG